MLNPKKLISERIKNIYESNYSPIVELYLKNFAQIAEFLRDEIYLDDSFANCEIYIDYLKIQKSVDSIVLDIIKFKEYHFNPKIETLQELNISFDDIYNPLWASAVHKKDIHASKAAAFIAKWLLKASPLYFLQPGGHEKQFKHEEYVKADLAVSINAKYALNCVLFCLELVYDDLSASELEALMYDFRFRNFEERHYFSRFELLMDKKVLKLEIIKIKSELDLANKYISSLKNANE